MSKASLPWNLHTPHAIQTALRRDYVTAWRLTLDHDEDSGLQPTYPHNPVLRRRGGDLLCHTHTHASTHRAQGWWLHTHTHTHIHTHTASHLQQVPRPHWENRPRRQLIGHSVAAGKPERDQTS